MTLEELEAGFKELRARVAKLENVAKNATKASAGEVADDFDLDGKYGDEEIRKMPSAKYWEGDDFTGCNMSATSADFLDAFAKYKDACAYMNEKSGDESKAKYIGYDRKSAARARGWAKRLREGWKSSAAASQESFAGSTADGSDDIPF